MTKKKKTTAPEEELPEFIGLRTNTVLAVMEYLKTRPYSEVVGILNQLGGEARAAIKAAREKKAASSETPSKPAGDRRQPKAVASKKAPAAKD